MTAQASVQLSNQSNNPLNTLRHWFEPHSTSRDEAFRERTIRVTSAFLLVAIILALLIGLIVFNSPITLFSLPATLVVALILCTGSILSVSQGRLLTAGWLLCAT